MDWCRNQHYITVNNGQIKTLEETIEIVGSKPTCYFEYRAIHTAISNFRPGRFVHEQTDTKLISELPKTAQQFRKFIVDKDNTESKAVELWQRRIGIMINSDIWQTAFNCTKETRLRLLHFKILYGIYPTNRILFKMGKAANINCNWCPNAIDTIEHFFMNAIKSLASGKP